jgi:hypothetical protein
VQGGSHDREESLRNLRLTLIVLLGRKNSKSINFFSGLPAGPAYQPLVTSLKAGAPLGDPLTQQSVGYEQTE